MWILVQSVDWCSVTNRNPVKSHVTPVHETSETLRRLAVRRAKAGERPSEVMASLGLCRTTIYRPAFVPTIPRTKF